MLKARLSPLIVTLLVLAAYYLGSPNFRWSEQPRAAPFGGDFLNEWTGALIVREGADDRLYDSSLVQKLQHDRTLTKFSWNPNKYSPTVYPHSTTYCSARCLP